MNENKAKPLSYYDDVLRGAKAPVPTSKMTAEDYRKSPMGRPRLISPRLYAFIAWGQLIGGIAFASLVMFSNADMIVKIPVAVASVGSGVLAFALLYAVSEAVDLLAEIRDK